MSKRPKFEKIQPEGMFQTPSYVHGLRAGNTLYVAGQVAKDANGELVAPGDAEGQARCVYENLRRVLEEAGATFDDVVKVTTFLVDRADSPIVSKIRFEYFGDHRPPHTGLIIAGLGSPEVKLEVEVIAVLDDDDA